MGGSSPGVGDILCVFELKSSWSLSRCWGEFALSNLVLPSSGVHVLNVLRSSFPFGGFILELSSGVMGVSHVFSEVLFDVPFESKSFVDVIINLTSDSFSFSLFSIGNEGHWMFIFDIIGEFVDSSFVSLEFLWPFSLSGSFECSFIGGNRFLVVNPVLSKFLVVLDISEFGVRPVLENLILVGNLEINITVLLLDEVEVVGLIFPSSFVFSVDLFFVLNVSLNVSTESFSFWSGVVNEFKEISNNSFVKIGASSPGGIEVSSLNLLGSEKGS